MKKFNENTEKPRLKLGTAFVCVECETLYDTRGNCPSCGSSAVVELSKWIPSMAKIPRVKKMEVVRW